MRLIDADALMERNIFYETEMDLEKAPTIDAVPVVRSGTVTLSDGAREYEIAEHEAWRVGDRAECIMLTRGTEDKNDDVIAEARYVWR